MRQHCPSCGNVVCPPSGKSTSILLVGDAPTYLDVATGTPFSTETSRFSWNKETAGKVLRKEFERCGVSLSQFRVCNLWLHEPNKSEDCFTAGYEHVLEEAKGKQAILLIGSDVVETFTSYKVSDVNGLQVDSSLLSAPIIYAMYNPALALHRAVGEVRFAIQQFTKRLEEENLL